MKILLAMDGSNHSRKAAEFISGVFTDSPQIRLLNVAGYEFNPNTPVGPLTEAQARLAEHPRFELPLDAQAQIWTDSGALVSSARRSGHPAEQILQEAREWGAELIVVGHHSGPATWFFGSVAEALVKGSSLPLLIVPSPGDSTPSPLGNRGG